MTLKGHVEKGKIVLDDPVELEEGALVRIEVITCSPKSLPESGAKRMDLYRDVIGSISDMPSDWSENHDKYLTDQPN